MKISTKGRYGLRAIIDLAVFSECDPVSISCIADRQNISERYLEQLMAMLKKAGLVNSIRGAGGGYQLAKPADQISVGDVLRALEGNIEPVDCAALNSDEGCATADSCVTKYVWQKINDTISETVDEIMIHQLAEESKKINEQDGCRQVDCNN
ncbi:MAG: RrF2 family transcriptional regulator [Lachnospiraceae bacterium]